MSAGPNLYRVTAYSTDTARQLGEVVGLDLDAAGRKVADMIRVWEGRGQRVHVIVARWYRS